MNVAGGAVLDRHPCDGAIGRDTRTTFEELTCLGDRLGIGTAEGIVRET